MNSLEFWNGFTTGYIEALLSERFEINPDIEFTYHVETYKNGWLLNFTWVSAFGETINRGIDNPLEYEDNEEDEQDFYFSFNEKTDKVMKEIYLELEKLNKL